MSAVALYKELKQLLQRWNEIPVSPSLEEVTAVTVRYTERDFQEAVLLKDYLGNLLIHYACWENAIVEVVQLLLDTEVENKSIYQYNITGMLPIHNACQHCDNIDNVRLLMDRDVDKKTLLARDIQGLVPLFIATEAYNNVELTKLVLREGIRDRIERLDFTEWKDRVQELIDDMTEDLTLMDDRREAVKDVYTRLSKYEIEHSMSLLALAVWKISCLHWGNFQFVSMQGLEDLGATDGAFDPAEYKLQRRIKSGVDMIIRGVRPFIPVNENTPTLPLPDAEELGVLVEVETHPGL
jgi:hypothetical protein